MANRNQYTYTPGYTGTGRGSAGGAGRTPPPSRQPAGSAPRAQAPRQQARPPQPGSQQPRRSMPPQQPQVRPMKDLLMFAMVLFVVPLIGLIGVFFTPFLWVFVALSAICLAAIWVLRCFAQRTRVMISLALLLLSVLSLLAVIDMSPKDNSYPVINGGVVEGQQNGGSGALAQNNSGVDTFPGLTASATATPPVNVGFSKASSPEIEDLPTVGEVPLVGENVTAGLNGGNQSNGQDNQNLLSGGSQLVGLPGLEEEAPPVNEAVSGAQAALVNYLTQWHNRDFEEMVKYTTSTWRNAQNMPAQQLYWNHNWWLLNSWALSTETTSPSADSATFAVITDLSKNNGAKTAAKMQYSALVFLENGIWLVDPDSLRNGIEVKETPMPEMGQSAEQTPEPDPTISPTTKLWYNSNGGKYYHAEEKCTEINEKYYSSMKPFMFSELSESPYSKLIACPTCKAPSK